LITQVIHQNSGRLLTLAPRKTMAGVPSTDDVRRRQEGRKELGRAGFLLLLLRGTRREEERERRDERRGHEMVVKREGHSGIHTETHEGGRERDCHCHDPYVKSDRGPSLDK
jgi:hypothetical protein